jgi:hypothetical protein
MWVVIGVMLKKVGMQNCIRQASIRLSNAKKYSETVVVTGEPLMWI